MISFFISQEMKSAHSWRVWKIAEKFFYENWDIASEFYKIKLFSLVSDESQIILTTEEILWKQGEIENGSLSPNMVKNILFEVLIILAQLSLRVKAWKSTFHLTLSVRKIWSFQRNFLSYHENASKEDFETKFVWLMLLCLKWHFQRRASDKDE